MTADQFRKMAAAGHHKYFKIQTVINTSSMVLFDGDGVLRKFDNVGEILKEFFTVRKLKYIDRKNFLEGMLKAQSRRLSNQARFILEKISGDIKMENKKKKVIVEQLVKGKYDPDPVKAWKEEVKRRELEAGADVGEDEVASQNGDDSATENAEETETESRLSDYDYLVTMSLIKLSEEEKDKLLRERDEKLRELQVLQAKSWADLWKADLGEFEKTLKEHEEKEAKEAREAGNKIAQKSKGAKGAKGGGRKAAPKSMTETLPTPNATRVAPVIDAQLKQKYERLQANKDKPKGERGKKKTAEEKIKEELEDDSLFNRVAKKSPKAAALMAGKKAPESGSMTKFLTTTKKKLDLEEDGEGKKAGGTKRKAAGPAGKKDGKRKRKKSWSGSDSDEHSEDPDDGGISSDDDEVMALEDDSPAPKASKKAIIDSDEEENGVEEVEESPSPAPVKAKPASKASKPAPKFKKATIDSDEDDEMEESLSPAPVKAKPAPKSKASKPAPKAKRKWLKKATVDSDDEESRPGSKATSKASSKSESRDSSPVAPRARGGRAAAKAVKYNFDDEDESATLEEDEDDDFEAESD